MSNTDKTQEQLVANEQQLKAANQQLRAANQQLTASEKEIKKLVCNLRERIKELDCLHKMGESISCRENLEDVFQDIINIIPLSLQYPELTCAKITIQGKEFKTKNYKKSRWKQSSGILVKGKVVGEIEVCYLKECPESDIGPFLKEEERMLYDIGERLGRVIEYEDAKNELLAANQHLVAEEQQLRAANQQLTAGEQQLLAANQQLTAGEQQLRAANQQLTAGEQRLLAANQQLVASEQQLRAANQQLTAGEQQLRAANQQLVASEQQLMASNQQLVESEKRFRGLFDASRDGYLIVMGSGEILDANPHMLQMLGYSLDEIKAKSFWEFTPEKWIEQERDVQGSVIFERGYTDLFEKEYIRKDGTVFPVEIQSYILEKGKDWESSQIGGFVRDITERKQADEAIKDRESNLRQIIDLVPLFILAKDEDDKYLIANKAVADIYGTTVENLIGKSDFDFSASKEEAENFIKDDQEVMKSGKQKFIPEEQITDAQGNLRYIQTTKIPFKTSMTKKPAIIGVSMDITERKQADDNLKAALAKAVESDRLKSAFLANMSHEIRTPMNGILGFIDLLNTPELDDTKKQEFTKIIHKSSDRLLNTINNLIDISKIEAGQVSLTNSEVCIDKLLNELHVFFNPEAESKALSLTFLPTVEKTQVTIFTDNEKLHGVLRNLIKNAIKYTDKGSIVYGYTLKDDLIEFFIEDTGLGVPEDRQEAIFDRFVQADVGDTRAFEGSGLGLPIAKAYVEMMGGEIRLISKEGKGTKFIFTIPYKAKMIQKIGSTVEIKEVLMEKTFGDMVVLIAEDDAVTALYYETILGDKFKKIIYAKNGEEVIKMFKDNPEIDLILMDIKMPLLNGYEASRKIREFNEDVIIIAQTAYAFKEEHKKALRAGCDGYIAKPVKKEKLIEMIELLMKKKKAGSQSKG